MSVSPLVRETLRISSNLASASPNEAPPPPIATLQSHIERLSCDVSSFGMVVNDQFVNLSLRLFCREDIDGRKADDFADLDNSKRFKKIFLRAVSLQSPQAPVDIWDAAKTWAYHLKKETSTQSRDSLLHMICCTCESPLNQIYQEWKKKSLKACFVGYDSCSNHVLILETDANVIAGKVASNSAEARTSLSQHVLFHTWN